MMTNASSNAALFSTIPVAANAFITNVTADSLSPTNSSIAHLSSKFVNSTPSLLKPITTASSRPSPVSEVTISSLLPSTWSLLATGEDGRADLNKNDTASSFFDELSQMITEQELGARQKIYYGRGTTIFASLAAIVFIVVGIAGEDNIQ
jgi:hypothetical protein